MYERLALVVPGVLHPWPLTAPWMGRSYEGYPSLPLAPALGWSATSQHSLRLQTHWERVYLLHPSHSLNPGVELQRGTAFTQLPAALGGKRSSGRVLLVLSEGASAMHRAPGSNVSSPRPHLLLERVLEPTAVVGVRTSSTPGHRFPCISP